MGQTALMEGGGIWEILDFTYLCDSVSILFVFD